MRVLRAADGEVLRLGFSPAGDALAAAVLDQGVYLWNLASGSAAAARGRQVDGDTIAQTHDLTFSPDGRFVYWFGAHGLRSYDRETRLATKVRLGTPGLVFATSRTPDGRRMLTQHSFPEPALTGWHAGDEGWVCEWSVSTERLSVHNQTICPTGRRVALLVRPIRSPRWWDTPIRLELRSAVNGALITTGEYPHYSQECDALTFAPDGSQLVAVHKTTLLVWPVPELGGPRVVRNDTRKHFTAAAYHPSGRYLFATSNDATAHVFETATWTRVARFSWNVGRLRSVAVSPDGSLAAAGTDSGEVVVWDVDV
jgi:WD40 repeat protein